MKNILDQVPDDILTLAEKEKVLHTLQTEPASYSIRLNTRKGLKTSNLENVSWCDNAFYIQDKPRFSMDPLWHAGSYYVQEAGSMFLHTVLKHLPFEQTPSNVLDLCAAPGGKTTLLADFFPPETTITANEILPARLKSLHENITKWGLSNVICTHNAPKDFETLPDFFDLVAVDAPCSGEGMLRRHDEALNQWSEKLVDECAIRQKNILTSALACLKPGGFLLYSTCTYNILENENNLQWLIEQEGCLPVELNVPNIPNVVITNTAGNKSYRFFPGLTKSEGFYITVVQKPHTHAKHWPSKTLNLKNVKNPVNEFIKPKGGEALCEEDGKLKLYATHMLPTLYHFQKRLKVTRAGTVFGTVKNNKFIPDETLGFSTRIDIDKHALITVDYATAVTYLATQNIQLKTEHRGFCFIVFEHTVLGLVNVLENRINNYYPAYWKLQRVDMAQQFTLLTLMG